MQLIPNSTVTCGITHTNSTESCGIRDINSTEWSEKVITKRSRVKLLAPRVLFIRIPQLSVLSYINTIAKDNSSFLQLRNHNLVLYKKFHLGSAIIHTFLNVAKIIAFPGISPRHCLVGKSGKVAKRSP